MYTSSLVGGGGGIWSGGGGSWEGGGVNNNHVSEFQGKQGSRDR